MKSRFLFSHKLKPFGWILFLIGLLLGVFLITNEYDFPNWEVNVFPLIGEKSLISSKEAFSWSSNNIADELASLLLIIGGILVSFSKTRDEDEYIATMRMESLIWATYVNYAVLVLAIIFVFDMSFLNVMIYNMFTILFIFMIRFHYLLFKVKKGMHHEE